MKNLPCVVVVLSLAVSFSAKAERFPGYTFGRLADGSIEVIVYGNPYATAGADADAEDQSSWRQVMELAASVVCQSRYRLVLDAEVGTGIYPQGIGVIETRRVKTHRGVVHCTQVAT